MILHSFRFHYPLPLGHQLLLHLHLRLRLRLLLHLLRLQALPQSLQRLLSFRSLQMALVSFIVHYLCYIKSDMLP